MTEQFAFKILSQEEILSYHQIRLECLKKYPQNFGTIWEEESNSTNFKFDKIIGQNDRTNFLMGAYKAKELIGICGFTKENRLKTKHTGEISQLYVKKEHSGQGVATALLKLTIETAFKNSELEQIILGVAEKNISAQQLYKRFGFNEYGRLKNYFKYKDTYEAQIFMVLSRK